MREFRTEYGRAFKRADGNLEIDYRTYDSLAEAEQFSVITWEGQIYDLVVSRQVTAWTVVEEERA